MEYSYMYLLNIGHLLLHYRQEDAFEALVLLYKCMSGQDPSYL